MHLPSKVDRIVAQVPEWRGRSTAVAPLSGGLTNHNYRVDVGDESYVLRIAGQDTAILGIDRGQEYVCTSIAAEIGIAPQVICFLADESALVTRFVPGEPVSSKALKDPEIRAHIVSTVRRCHTGPPFPGLFCPFETVRKYHSEANARDVPFSSALPTALLLMGRIEDAIGPTRSRRLCPCHNDLLMGNLIFDGAMIRIIDWEYAAMGDPFFDLGNLAAHQQLNAEETAAMLQEYFDEVSAEHIARVELMRLASDLREALWCFLQVGISKLGLPYGEFAEDYLRRFLERSTSSMFSTWLQSASTSGV